MPHSLSALSGPFLELSTANLHLNDLSVDQLAALWNVFTKVGDSLHKGRRLENFVWRAWHREAHLLPPDASWSDFADCTPLETPALSRAGSISQGLQRRPIVNQLTPGHWTTAVREDENLPSDPESGAGWSDESGDESPKSNVLEPVRRQPLAVTPHTSREPENQNTPSQLAADRGRLPSRETGLQQIAAPPPAEPSLVLSPQTATTVSASMRRRIGDSLALVGHEIANDRKRAASSSSSAFGSRARVRHSNLRKSTRPRPLSFQAALESLTTGSESDDLTRLAQEHQRRGLGVAHERRSFQGPAPIDILKSDATELGDNEDHEDLIAASHSSAPAGSGFETRLVGRSEQADVTSLRRPSPVDMREGSDDRVAAQLPQVFRSIPSPSHSAEPKPAADTLKEKSASTTGSAAAQAQPVPFVTNETAPDMPSPAAQRGPESKKAKAKFFLSASVSKSFDDEDHHFPGQQPEASSVEDEMQPDSEVAVDRSATPIGRKVDGVDASHPSIGKGKSDLRSTGLIGTHRNRSGASLHKGKGKMGGGRSGSSSRLVASGLMMTKAAAPIPSTATALVPSANTKGPAKPALVNRQQSAKKNKPVKFTMGSSADGGEDDDGFSDEDDETVRRPGQAVAPSKPEITQADTSEAAGVLTGRSPDAEAREKGKQSAPAEEDGWQNEDEDGWSSDTSAEAEDERRRVAEAASRRRKAEEEHQKSLFQKIPIRSASTADLPSAVPVRPKTPLDQTSPSAQPAPTRGLLSSLFHPEQEPHSPPGQLHGRPHASAADLRGDVGGGAIARPASTSGHKAVERERKQHRPPSFIGSLPRAPEAGGPLRTSKSAVALPVLTTKPSRDAADEGLSRSDAEEELQNSSASYVGRAQQSVGGGRDGGDQSVASLNTSKTLLQKQRSSSKSRSRERPPSSSAGDLPHATELTEALPVTTHRRESNPLPTPAPPQTPRTTRRNMLRDELSESLRQNLLWERQSRNRMLGIGANVSTTTRPTPAVAPAEEVRGPAPPQLPSAAPRAPRRESVLGGGQLRPLTQGNNPHHHNVTTALNRPGATGVESGAMGGGAMDSHPYSSGDGGHHHQTSYLPHHHHSRSTPHLPRVAAAAAAERRNWTAEAHGRDHAHVYQHGHNNNSHRSGGSSGLLEVHQHHHHPALQRSQSGPASRPSSTQTSDEEEGTSVDAVDRDGRDGGSGVGGAGAVSGAGQGGRKKVMWSGGYPNYHQQGW